MKQIFLLALVAAAMTACDSDLNSECGIPDPQTGLDEIAVNAMLADISSIQSKTAYTGSTAAWANGDAIGIFSPQAKGPNSNANVKFTVSGIGTSPSWTTTTPIYWADGTTAHKFVAYAPHAVGSDTYTAIPLPALNNQTGTINSAQDFLYSKNQWTAGVTRAAAPVALTFTHALSLIEFDFTITGFTTGTTLTNFVLASPTSSDKVYSSDATSSTIDISTGTITAGTATNTATVTPATAPALSATITPLYALILPGTFAAPTLAITLSEGGTTISLTAVPLVTTTFAAGSKYIYTVAISRTAITISNPTITDWTAGNGPGGSLSPSI